MSDMTTRQHERTQFLRCAVLRHAWFEYESSTWKPLYGTPMVFRCERCGTERRETYGSQGQVIQRFYDYPPGYSYAKGTRPKAGEFRLQLIAQRKIEARARKRAG